MRNGSVEPTADAMQVVILERNKLVGRKLARLFLATGASAVALDEPAALGGAIDGADVVCADAFDGDAVVEQLRGRPGLRGVLWTAEPLRRSLRYLVESPGINHVLARRDFESAPRAGEVVMLARRLAGGAAPSLPAYLDWGFSAIDLDVRVTIEPPERLDTEPARSEDDGPDGAHARADAASRTSSSSPSPPPTSMSSSIESR